MLMLRKCPACRARLSGDEPHAKPCRRCGSDLSALRRVYHQACAHRALARRALVLGLDWEAVRYASKAMALVDTHDTRMTLAAALVALGRPRAALHTISEGESR